jgi:hypothetical protein
MNNTNEWILTDDDYQQYIRPTDNEDIFDCIEMDACASNKYRVYFAVVDVDSYLECNRAEVRSVLHFYGYGNSENDDSPIEEVSSTYPNASQIIAECLFETCSSLDSEDLFTGSDEECIDFIQNWIKTH